MSNPQPLQTPPAAASLSGEAAMVAGYADHVDPDMSGADAAIATVAALAAATWAAAQPVD